MENTSINISFLIITFNEEENIKRCLESIKWSDDIAIVDSGSTDRTIEICNAYENTSVYFRKFDDYASQRNWLIDNHNFKNDWIFVIDADESLDEGLSQELHDCAKLKKADIYAYAVRRKNYFLGKYLKHCGYPDFYIIRMFKRGKGKFLLSVNERLEVQGRMERLKNYLCHDNNKGLTDFVEKHNRYSSVESEIFIKKAKKNNILNSIFSFNKLKNEKLLKNLIIFLPCKGVVTFFYLYILRLGFLDGEAGFIYCVMKAFYFFLIEIKMTELRMRGVGCA